MDYYQKYLKYKSKYIDLKNQYGGLSEEQQTNFDQFYSEIFTDIELEESKFITYEKIVERATNDEILDKLIILIREIFLEGTNGQFNFTLLNDSKVPSEYYQNIELLLEHCKEIQTFLQKTLEVHDITKTLLIIPGDSPSYFMYIIQIMYPDFYNNLNIIFIPISKLRNTERVQQYIRPIIDTEFSNNTNLNKIFIIDYSESGCSSFKYLYDIIEYKTKEIYFIDLNYFFPYKDTFVDFVDFDTYTTVEEIIPAEKDFFSCDGNEYTIPYIERYLYPYKIDSQLEYPIGFPEKLQNNIKILRFFSDDKEGTFGKHIRCQFSNKMEEGGLVINPNNIKLCDLFRLFIYYYVNKKDLLNEKTRIYLESLTV